MKYLAALGCIAIACICNGLQIPGMWDIFDIGAILMTVNALTITTLG